MKNQFVPTPRATQFERNHWPAECHTQCDYEDALRTMREIERDCVLAQRRLKEALEVGGAWCGKEWASGAESACGSAFTRGVGLDGYTER